MWETTSAGQRGFSDGNATDIGMGPIDAMNFHAGRRARAAASYSPPASLPPPPPPPVAPRSASYSPLPFLPSLPPLPRYSSPTGVAKGGESRTDGSAGRSSWLGELAVGVLFILYFGCTFSFIIIPVLGAIFGAYYEIHGGSVLDATGIAFSFTGRQFTLLGHAVANLVPASTVFSILGTAVAIAGSIYVGILAAAGAFAGSAIAWVVIDVVSGIFAAH